MRIVKSQSKRSRLLAASLLMGSTISYADSWINRGGMWPPAMIGQQEELLESLGLEIPARELSDPTSDTLQGVVSLNGCSGSFVSTDGLVITNSHCVRVMLTHFSNEDRDKTKDTSIDFVKTGFHAKTRDQERNAGKSRLIYVTQSQEDVTDKILGGISDIADPVARGQEIDNRIKALVKETEDADKNIRAEVVSFYRGETYLLIRKLEITDVRLVFGPPRSVGNFGGETDNWAYPRHSNDFALLRAYVGPDQKPRDYAPDNVPYKPSNILKVANNKDSWINDQDLVLVAGYPGSTNRLHTAAEVRDDVGEDVPYGIESFGSLLALLNQIGKDNELHRTKVQSYKSSLDNYLKNQQQASKALESIQYVQQKANEQKELEAWINSDPERASEWGPTLANMESIRQEFRADWLVRSAENSLFLGFSSRIAQVVQNAVTIVRMAQERSKPDAEREAPYQERQWEKWLQATSDAQRAYDPQISVAVMEWAIKRGIELAKKGHALKVLPLFVDVVAAKEDPTVIRKTLEELVTKTQMGNIEFRQNLFKTATVEELEASTDPVIQLAVKLAPFALESEQRAKKMAGSYVEAAPAYIKALRAFKASQGQLLAPDANSTLRVTFGHVKGYTKPGTKEWKAPFTNILDINFKHKWNDEEFEAEYGLLQQLHARNFEPFTESTFGLVPVNFIAALDTTGGNSGSACLNAKGELVGLLFDGNQDALYSDWHFDEKEVRSILVDIRYALWYLAKVANAKDILAEMGVTEI